MKILPALSFVALLAVFSLHPLMSAADVNSNPGKPAMASGELVDCFFEQNAGHAACQQFRDSAEKKTTPKKAGPVSDDGYIAKHANKNP